MLAFQIAVLAISPAIFIIVLVIGSVAAICYKGGNYPNLTVARIETEKQV
jgi:hypothetical protein